MKLIGNRLEVFQGRGGNLSHHSLVTPIDWKPRKPTPHTIQPRMSPLVCDNYCLNQISGLLSLFAESDPLFLPSLCD
jgi:hypothetical protein